MTIETFPPSVDLMEEVAGRLRASGADYSRNLVVFPGKRPSHFVRRIISRRENRSFIPPVIYAMDEFVDFLYEEKLNHVERQLDSIDAVAILYEIHRRDDKRLGGQNFLAPDSFFPVGLKIYRDIEELLIEGIDARRLREIIPLTDVAVPPATAGRLQSLLFFYEEFYKEVGRLGFSTRSSRYCRCAAEIEESQLAGFTGIIVAGFFAPTRCERDLFRRMCSWEGTCFLFQEGSGLDERLRDLMPARPEASPPAIPPAMGVSMEPVVHFYQSPDTHGQVFGLSRVLRQEMEKGVSLDEKTVVVLPSGESLFPVERLSLGLVGEGNYNISLGYSLYRTPLFGFLASLMQLITTMDGDRLYVPDYLGFVLHPYTKNIYFGERADVTRVMFHTIEEAFTQNRNRTFVRLEEIEENEALYELILQRALKTESEVTREQIRRHLRTIHENTLKRFLSFGNVADFAAKAAEVLTYVYDHSTARLHPLFFPFSETFVRYLGIISRSLMKDVAFANAAGYFNFFKKYIATCYVPFEGTPLRGVQVLGFLETRNLKFDRVFVLDANEEVLPDTRKEETLLPLKARQILSLPTYMDRDKLAAHYFDTLIKGAREVHLFFVENDRKERSRFVEKLLWERQKRERKSDAREYVTSVRYRINLENRLPLPMTKSQEIISFLRERAYDATQLDTYLRCPLQFFYRYVLSLGEREEVSGEIERTEVGRFVHDALFEYFKTRKGVRLAPDVLDVREMDSVVDTLFEKFYGPDPAGPAYLLKRQVQEHLSDFLRNYQVPLAMAEAVTIEHLEYRLEGTIGPFRLKGILDRVETRGERGVIVDYKTGASGNYLKINFDRLDPEVRSSWEECIGTLQLPFYKLLYENQTALTAGDVDAIFVLLGRSHINRSIELPLFQRAEEREEGYEKARQVIFGLLNEIVDPDVPFVPASPGRNGCTSCSYQYLCGTQWKGR